jgi:hypothetical protein
MPCHCTVGEIRRIEKVHWSSEFNTRESDEVKMCLGQASAMSLQGGAPAQTQFGHFGAGGGFGGAFAARDKFRFADVKVVDVIGNPAATGRFEAKKEDFRSAGKTFREAWVFHGTPRLLNGEAIAKSSFKTGGVGNQAVTHGAVWGQGVYTDVNPATPIRCVN